MGKLVISFPDKVFFSLSSRQLISSEIASRRFYHPRRRCRRRHRRHHRRRQHRRRYRRRHDHHRRHHHRHHCRYRYRGYRTYDYDRHGRRWALNMGDLVTAARRLSHSL